MGAVHESACCLPVHFFATVPFSGSHISFFEALDYSPVRLTVTHLYNLLDYDLWWQGFRRAASPWSRAWSRVLPYRKMAANSEFLDDESMSALPINKKAKKVIEDPSLVVS